MHFKAKILERIKVISDSGGSCPFRCFAVIVWLPEYQPVTYLLFVVINLDHHSQLKTSHMNSIQTHSFFFWTITGK